MAFIFIETCTERSLLFFFDETLRFTKEFPFGLSNSKHIFPAIEEGLNATGMKLSELEFIGVGIGPGSYTGIRVGAVTAKTLAYALNIPLIGIPTLHSFTPCEDGNFLVAIDAKIGGAYIVSGTKTLDTVDYTGSPQVVELTDLKPFLEGTSKIVTPNAAMLKPKIEALYPDLCCQWQTSSPDPKQMAKLALESFKNGKGTKDLNLLYLRKTQAEREREKCTG